MEMACENEVMVLPCFDFCKGGVTLEEGSEEWKEMSMKVREACESYGCFILKYDEISIKGAREVIFKSMKPLFDVSEETKQQHISPKPFNTYKFKNFENLNYESFGVDDAEIENFTNLMWPQGNTPLREALECMSSKMSEISMFVLKMIMEGYGVSQNYISAVESIKSCSNIRFNKYKASANSNDYDHVTRFPHTDKKSLTFLCDDGVQGLHVLSKTGKWSEITIPQHGFVVLVGDILKAWSNGRLHAATHRVEVSGERERYSFGVFLAPKEEVIVEPHELLDDTLHPLRYRPFNYGKFLSYCASNLKDDALEVFAGL
ncbi:2-oxoglutarate-dependent dioxygenase AOP2-like [Vigna radiata var. radiata]|uniref:2-oxoglutarate-dependent dioxygenase DAO n=1 Tax=Vigna radiata var. radiata TaxID=3916 RepID=A0A1S3TZY4_VIGRR|nr:2-oxoglutarate-dependent dioxygenase AOP2-like [Vigna radiata var. radiata]